MSGKLTYKIGSIGSFVISAAFIFGALIYKNSYPAKDELIKYVGIPYAHEETYNRKSKEYYLKFMIDGERFQFSGPKYERVSEAILCGDVVDVYSSKKLSSNEVNVVYAVAKDGGYLLKYWHSVESMKKGTAFAIFFGVLWVLNGVYLTWKYKNA